MENFKYGSSFICDGKEYDVVGEDPGRNEIECITIPFDGNFYWFRVLGDDKVQPI